MLWVSPEEVTGGSVGQEKTPFFPASVVGGTKFARPRGLFGSVVDFGGDPLALSAPGDMLVHDVPNATYLPHQKVAPTTT